MKWYKPLMKNYLLFLNRSRLTVGRLCERTCYRSGRLMAKDSQFHEQIPSFILLGIHKFSFSCERSLCWQSIVNIHCLIKNVIWVWLSAECPNLFQTVENGCNFGSSAWLSFWWVKGNTSGCLEFWKITKTCMVISANLPKKINPCNIPLDLFKQVNKKIFLAEKYTAKHQHQTSNSDFYNKNLNLTWRT